MRGFPRFARVLCLVLGFGTFVSAADALARAGGGRSSGRSGSGFSRPSGGGFNRDSGQAQRYNPPPAQPNSARAGAAPSGGLMRGIAGGMAGGFLGSMLFNSLGHASGGSGGMGGGGGIGLFELMLLAAAGYFGLRWWRNRQSLAQASSSAGSSASSSASNYQSWNRVVDTQAVESLPTGLSQISGPSLSSDDATDLFFKIQSAWTRRDLKVAEAVITPEYRPIMAKELDELRRVGQINKLENITVRRAEVSDSYSENGQVLCSVRFTANVLDYTIDEKSGRVLEGSDQVPVKFEEEWIFANNGQSWQLAGIQQF